MPINYHDAILRLQVIFDSAVDGIIIINTTGIIEEVNLATCTLFGYNKEDMIGNNVSMLMPHHYAVKHDGYIDDYLKTNNAKIIGKGREVTGQKKNGEIFPFWLAVSEVKLAERSIFTGFVHDLSDIKHAETRLKNHNEELEKKVVERTYELENAVNQLLSLNKQLEKEITNKIKIQNQLKEREAELESGLAKERELGELKSRFVSMASHEFRTPLSTILSSVSLIARYTEGNQQANRNKHIDKIKSSVMHLTGILNDFLSMNKLEEGKVDTHFESFDIVEIWNSVIDEMHTILKADQKLINTLNSEKSCIVSDKKTIKNIIINLMSNAIKYTENNGEIRCNLDINDDFFTINIKDNGMGIPLEDQKHLFQRFFRASNAVNIEGTGLGLNIVKKYVEMLGGELSFKSEHFVGTEFNIVIPTKPRNITY